MKRSRLMLRAGEVNAGLALAQIQVITCDSEGFARRQDTTSRRNSQGVCGSARAPGGMIPGKGVAMTTAAMGQETRKIHKVWRRRPTIEGAGVHLRRAFGYDEAPLFDPFLLFNDFRAKKSLSHVWTKTRTPGKVTGSKGGLTLGGPAIPPKAASRPA